MPRCERSARELSLLADQVVKKRLERATGVARVDVGGLTVRQVRIDLDPQRLRALQLTPSDVSTALQRANADLNRVDYRALNADARTQYDTAKRFVRQADDAIRTKNLVFAKNLAEKAATIAAQLAGR